MIDGNEHSKRVDAWLQGAPGELALEQLLRRFERVFSAILGRAQQTLGEVTLIAIVDRVLYVATEKFPLVSALEVEGGAISCRKLLERTRELSRDEVVSAIRFVLAEFLVVLGNLTAEVLTPALHAELEHEVEDLPANKGARRAHSPGKDDKGSKS